MKTADTLRNEAADCDQQARESFDRCDTDGFASQYASTLTGRLKRRQADILEHGGVATFHGLYEGDRRVKAEIREGEFGYFWLLHPDEQDIIDRRGKRFVPYNRCKGNGRILKGLGLTERKELAPADAEMAGGGYGFSGMSGVYIATVRTGCRWGTDAVLKEEA